MQIVPAQYDTAKSEEEAHPIFLSIGNIVYANYINISILSFTTTPIPKGCPKFYKP